MDPSLALIYVKQQRQRRDAESARYGTAQSIGSTKPRRSRRAWRVGWRRRPYEGMPTPAISNMSPGAA
jgi:hypothetical protein